MSIPPVKFDLRESVLRVVPNVISTMLEMEAIPTERTLSVDQDRVSAIIGIGSDTVSGMFYFHLPVRLGALIAEKLLGATLDRRIGDHEINDAIGELCNMVAGGLKGAMADLGIDTAMSPPSIIRGKGFAIESQAALTISHFHFSCGQDVLDLEVHLKLEL